MYVDAVTLEPVATVSPRRFEVRVRVNYTHGGNSRSITRTAVVNAGTYQDAERQVLRRYADATFARLLSVRELF